MDLDQARDFVRSHPRAVLATRTPGGIQQSPVLVGVDDEGRLTVSSTRDGVQDEEPSSRPVGAALRPEQGLLRRLDLRRGRRREVVSLPEAMEPLVEYYRGISGETDWDEYRAGMERERRVIIQITPTRAGPDRQG